VVAEPNVGLMTDAVSAPTGADRLLTLHSVPSEQPAGLKKWLVSSGTLQGEGTTLSRLGGGLR
jgi:hypothetical protein